MMFMSVGGPTAAQLRPFVAVADDAAVVDCHNAANPDEPMSETEFRYRDAYLPEGRWSGRWVVESDNCILAYCQARHQVGDHHPDTYRIDIQVRPDRRGQGIGTVLYRHLDNILRERSARILHGWARADHNASIRFLEARGHRETRQARESRCVVVSFRPDTMVDPRPQLAAEGIRITTIGAYAAQCQDAMARWHAVSETVGADAPSNGPYVPVPFTTWIQRLHHPGYRPDAQFLAVCDDVPIGVASLWHRSADRDLDTGVTGVVRKYRRRGIATALKLTAFEYARRIGATAIRTDNAADNVGMLEINRRMGFMEMPAWVQYTRQA